MSSHYLSVILGSWPLSTVTLVIISMWCAIAVTERADTEVLYQHEKQVMCVCLSLQSLRMCPPPHSQQLTSRRLASVSPWLHRHAPFGMRRPARRLPLRLGSRNGPMWSKGEGLPCGLLHGAGRLIAGPALARESGWMGLFRRSRRPREER